MSRLSSSGSSTGGVVGKSSNNDGIHSSSSSIRGGRTCAQTTRSMHSACDVCLVVIVDLHEDIWKQRRFQLHNNRHCINSNSSFFAQKNSVSAASHERHNGCGTHPSSIQGMAAAHQQQQRPSVASEHFNGVPSDESANACISTMTKRAGKENLDHLTTRNNEEGEALCAFMQFLQCSLCGFIRALALLAPVLQVAVVGMNGARSCLLHAGRVPTVLIEAVGLSKFFASIMEKIASFIVEGDVLPSSRTALSLPSLQQQQQEPEQSAQHQQQGNQWIFRGGFKREKIYRSSEEHVVLKTEEDSESLSIKRVKIEPFSTDVPSSSCNVKSRSNSSINEASNCGANSNSDTSSNDSCALHRQSCLVKAEAPSNDAAAALPIQPVPQQQQKHKQLEQQPRRICGSRYIAGKGDSMLAGALSLALCYLNRVSKEALRVPERRILLLDGSSSNVYASQYMPLMNLAFVAAKANIIIDCCAIGPNPSSIPEQLSDVSRGVHLKFAQAAPPSPISSSTASSVSNSNGQLDDGQALLQLLLFWLLPSAALRPAIAALSIHHRRSNTAVCVCHHHTVEVCSVCSCCLAIYCSEKDPRTGKERISCDVCKSRFARGLLKNKMAGGVDLPCY